MAFDDRGESQSRLPPVQRPWLSGAQFAAPTKYRTHCDGTGQGLARYVAAVAL